MEQQKSFLEQFEDVKTALPALEQSMVKMLGFMQVNMDRLDQVTSELNAVRDASQQTIDNLSLVLDEAISELGEDARKRVFERVAEKKQAEIKKNIEDQIAAGKLFTKEAVDSVDDIVLFSSEKTQVALAVARVNELSEEYTQELMGKQPGSEAKDIKLEAVYTEKKQG